MQYAVTPRHRKPPATASTSTITRRASIAAVTALFASDAKFDSGCGWPSYFEPSTRERPLAATPRTVQRTEIIRNVHAHPPRGPRCSPTTGLRPTSINSAALKFEEA